MVAQRELPEGIIELFRSIDRPVTKTELFCMMWNYGLQQYIQETEAIYLASGKPAWDVVPKSLAKSIIERCSWTDLPRPASPVRHDGEALPYEAKQAESKLEQHLSIMYLDSKSPGTPYFITDPDDLLPVGERIEIPSLAELQDEAEMEDLFDCGGPDLWVSYKHTPVPRKKFPRPRN